MHYNLLLEIDKNVAEIFDFGLTPENALVKGYRYIDDINFDLYIKHNSTKDVLKLLRQIGCKLGTPSKNFSYTTFYGIYRPKDIHPQKTTLPK